MQFSTFLVSFMATAVLASPVERSVECDTCGGGGGGGSTPEYAACTPGLYSTLQCCATDVLGVADLDCGNPSAVPTSAEEFQELCAAAGQRARCCILPVLGQSVLCETPIGVQ
ncbi:hydrophobin precursor [Xylariaceae sp. FL0662B]|nr:hydrophobin precursor [Xylariaceae sp. FL0662B]